VGAYLVVVLKYIKAPQSNEYDQLTYRQLNEQLHALKPQNPHTIHHEEISNPYQTLFEETLAGILTKTPVDEINADLQHLIQNYDAEIQADLLRFYALCEELQAQEWQFVITHGDAPGNTLVQSPHELYLIDWDDILLAPPERDVWLLAHSQEVLAGYTSAVPNFQVRPELFQYYVYRRYFDDMLEYFVEILGDFSASHRTANLADLQRSCFDEWLLPMIRNFSR
jgi:spectinomycin phosphotransferase